jgi:hypothetical protein
VSRPTFNKARKYVDFTALPKIKVKGKTDEIAIYRPTAIIKPKVVRESLLSSPCSVHVESMLSEQ